MSTYSLSDKTILITGGTGSWGSELLARLLRQYHPKQIRIYSRGEHKQLRMKDTIRDPRVKFIIGDVRDKNILGFAMRGVDVVFHLAALKHVPTCEENNWEAVLTNLYGTQNVIECAIENNVERVVDISTDKAVDPFNVYGVTKAGAEKMIINANVNYASKTKFICIRGGNVLGTTGSVIPVFKRQIKEYNEITVTDPTMTRFLSRASETIRLILTAVEYAQGGEIFVLRMPATTVGTIAQVMIELFGNSQTRIQSIGTRPGEKKHECLVSRYEIPKAKEWDKLYFVVLPQYDAPELVAHYAQHAPLLLNEFTSNTAEQLDHDNFKAMLQKEAWLFDDSIDLTT